MDNNAASHYNIDINNERGTVQTPAESQYGQFHAKTVSTVSNPVHSSTLPFTGLNLGYELLIAALLVLIGLGIRKIVT